MPFNDQMIPHVDAEYMQSLYNAWQKDHNSVPKQWHYFFSGMTFAGAKDGTAVAASEPSVEIADLQARVDSLVYAYRDIGYLSAHLDPLKQRLECAYELSLDAFGLSDEDLERRVSGGHFPDLPNPTLRELINALEETYCRTVGVEYLHIQDTDIRRWLQQRMEPVRNKPALSRDKQLLILQNLIEANEFERFLHTHYIGQKRFSLEGAETLIPALHSLVERAPEVGVVEVILGMSHRGRLNVLANIMDKSISEIFSEFEDNFIPESYGGDGDVKYHLGFSTDHMSATGKKCHVSLTANPSHLEMVSPVVQGRTRAKQRLLYDTDRRLKALPVVIHGDAAFSGQGVVAETFNLSQLKGYRTGGTIHFIVNNQIGFTTSPGDARSSCFPTEIAKMLQIPIFHVNADDPEAMVGVVELALDFRQTFGRDVVIDMFCFRRHGHNEGDEPSFTQPRLYKLIKAHPGTHEVYAEQLKQRGVLSDEYITKLRTQVRDFFKRAFKLAKESAINHTIETFQGQWENLGNQYNNLPVDTGVEEGSLDAIAQRILTVPADFRIHRKLNNIITRKLKAYTTERICDWALAESLAIGSLLLEKIPVRLSGQDSARGTFSHRHAIWWDTEDNKSYIPLNNVGDEQARFCVYNSPLSELAVLAFEYGYSLVEPRMLLMWEAQFGDFANGAQVIIDQFIAGSESKWRRASGLVLLLPHGYEGQGPEHSTAHLERFLQLCAEDNMQVCNPTLPSQFFHLLRRQMHRNFRKPLIVMTPKSLLRHPAVVSKVAEFSRGSFQEVLGDELAPHNVLTVAFCSGKVYYDLIDKRKKLDRQDIAIIRIEQYYPFPAQQLAEVLSLYHKANRFYWVQEEPANRGAWTFIKPLLTDLLKGESLRYFGRKASASPATGSLKQHRREQEEIVRQVFENK